jgi:hypothetical protein
MLNINTTPNEETTMERFKAEWQTAVWMACTPHNLSADGMTATLSGPDKNGQIWKWSDHFHLWARVG